MATRSCCSTPRTAVAGARSATSAPAPCRSTKRSSASATIHTSWNCARLTIEPRQRIDTQSEGRSLETTVYEDEQLYMDNPRIAADLVGLERRVAIARPLRQQLRRSGRCRSSASRRWRWAQRRDSSQDLAEHALRHHQEFAYQIGNFVP